MPFPINVYRGVKIELSESIPIHGLPLKRVINCLHQVKKIEAPNPTAPSPPRRYGLEDSPALRGARLADASCYVP
jgi:hypothetical protein